MSEIGDCAFCKGYALQSMTPSGLYECHCMDQFDKGCGETGPTCVSSQDSIDEWNAQQAEHRARMGKPAGNSTTEEK